MIVALNTMHPHLLRGQTPENLERDIKEISAKTTALTGVQKMFPHITLYFPGDENDASCIEVLRVPEHMILFLANTELAQNGISGTTTCQVIFEERNVAYFNYDLLVNPDAGRSWRIVELDYQTTWAKGSWGDGLDVLQLSLLQLILPVDITVPKV